MSKPIVQIRKLHETLQPDRKIATTTGRTCRTRECLRMGQTAYDNAKDLGLARSIYISGLLVLGIYYLKVAAYPLYDWLGLVSVSIIAMACSLRHKLPNISKYTVIAGWLLVFSASLTIPFTIDPVESAISALFYIYLVAIWLPLGSIVLTQWSHLRLAFCAMVFSMEITSLYAVGQKLLSWPILGEYVFWGRMTGLTRHPNELGTFCAMTLPYAFALTQTAGSKATRLFWITAAAAGTIGLFLSGSMTGGFALISGILVYAWFARFRGRLWIICLTVVCALIIAIGATVSGGDGSWSLTQRMYSFIQDEDGRVTLYSRHEANRYALHCIKEQPVVGRGYHSKALNVNTAIHNGFLRAWFDGGVFSFLAFLIILSGAFRDLVRVQKWASKKGVSTYMPYITAIEASFAAFLVMNIASPVLYQRSSWFPVAFVFVITRIVQRERS